MSAFVFVAEVDFVPHGVIVWGPATTMTPRGEIKSLFVTAGTRGHLDALDMVELRLFFNSRERNLSFKSRKEESARVWHTHTHTHPFNASPGGRGANPAPAANTKMRKNKTLQFVAHLCPNTPPRSDSVFHTQANRFVSNLLPFFLGTQMFQVSA